MDRIACTAQHPGSTVPARGGEQRPLVRCLGVLPSSSLQGRRHSGVHDPPQNPAHLMTGKLSLEHHQACRGGQLVQGGLGCLPRGTRLTLVQLGVRQAAQWGSLGTCPSLPLWLHPKVLGTSNPARGPTWMKAPSATAVGSALRQSSLKDTGRPRCQWWRLSTPERLPGSQARHSHSSPRLQTPGTWACPRTPTGRGRQGWVAGRGVLLLRCLPLLQEAWRSLRPSLGSSWVPRPGSWVQGLSPHGRGSQGSARCLARTGRRTTPPPIHSMTPEMWVSGGTRVLGSFSSGDLGDAVP